MKFSMKFITIALFASSIEQFGECKESETNTGSN
jgi:hypothetical protein